jgi:hypothetical protein
MSYGYIGDLLVNFNPNNLFLDMLAAIDEPQEGGVQAGQPPPAVEADVSRRIGCSLHTRCRRWRKLCS